MCLMADDKIFMGKCIAAEFVSSKLATKTTKFPFPSKFTGKTLTFHIFMGVNGHSGVGFKVASEFMLCRSMRVPLAI